MKNYGILMSLGILTACGNTAPAKHSEAASSVSKASYAVAGVALGMSPDEAKAKLSSAGYEFKTKSDYFNYSQLLRRAQGEDVLREKMMAVHEQYYTKGNEKIMLNYVSLPAGPVVEAISYTPPSAILSRDQAITEMTKRYGAPVLSNAPSGSGPQTTWCEKPLRECGKGARMEVSSSGDITHIWVEDPSFNERQRASFSAASGKKATF